MKWFTVINEAALPLFWNMLRVAVVTRPPNLEPFCIFDGDDRAAVRWLSSAGVTVIPWRLSFAEALHHYYPHRFEEACGKFLRCDIPLICEESGITDRYVLYTDCDVMFTGAVDLDGWRPAYLAAAPEFAQNNWTYFNSGVMLMNRPAFGTEVKRLVPLLATVKSCDQAQLNQCFAHRWSWLPVEYNWKSYWEVNPAARIIHFHGPKVHSGTPEDIAHHTQEGEEMRKGGFDHYAAVWREYFAYVESL